MAKNKNAVNAERNFNLYVPKECHAQDVIVIVQYLFEIMIDERIEPVYGRGKKKNRITTRI